MHYDGLKMSQEGERKREGKEGNNRQGRKEEAWQNDDDDEPQ